MKKAPTLKVVNESERAVVEKKPRHERSYFEVIPYDELSIPERRKAERIVREVCPDHEVLAVACTARNWDLRPVIAPFEEEGSSLIRFLGPEVTLSVSISARVNDLFERLSKPNNLSSHLLSWGVFEGQIWYRRELVEQTLADLFEVGSPIALEQALSIIRAVVDQLSNWHARGIAHGHLTATNIFPKSDGTVSLLDAGIAVSIIQASQALGLEDFPKGYQRSSFAPEVLEQDEIEYASDIFGLGKIIEALLSKAEDSDEAPSGDKIEEAKLLRDIAKVMRHSEPSKRPSLSEIKALLVEKKTSLQEFINNKKKNDEPAQAEEPSSKEQSPKSEERESSASASSESESKANEGEPKKKKKKRRRRKRKKKIQEATSEESGEDSSGQENNAESATAEQSNVDEKRVRAPEDSKPKENVESKERDDSNSRSKQESDPEDIAALKEAILNKEVSVPKSPKRRPTMPRPVSRASKRPQKNQKPEVATKREEQVEFETPVEPRQERVERRQPQQHRQEAPTAAPYQIPVREPQFQAPNYHGAPYRQRTSTQSISAGQNFTLKQLIVFVIMAGIFVVFAYRFYQSRSYVEQPTSMQELRVAWESGLQSQMAAVAETALGTGEPSRLAEMLIVSNVLNGQRIPSGNTDLIRIAFDARWEQQLRPADRRAALGLALAGLLPSFDLKNMPPIAELHPAVILATTASAGSSAHRILEGIPAKLLVSLPPPVGLAFKEMIGSRTDVSCADPGIRTLARIVATDTLDSEQMRDFLSDDITRRLRVLAALYSYDNLLARKALVLLLAHPNLVIDHEFISWGKKWNLLDWKELESGDKMFLLAGIPPSAKLSIANIGKLFAHPASAIRMHAIDFALDNIKLKHPAGYDVLRMLKSRPELLSERQTVLLAQIVENPEGVSRKYVTQWIESRPPQKMLEAMLLATARNSKATIVDFEISRELQAKGWTPSTDDLRRLMHHPDDFTRIYAYSKVYAMRDRGTSKLMIEKALRGERNPEFREQLRNMLKALETSRVQLTQ